jgi:surface protein
MTDIFEKLPPVLQDIVKSYHTFCIINDKLPMSKIDLIRHRFPEIIYKIEICPGFVIDKKFKFNKFKHLRTITGVPPIIATDDLSEMFRGMKNFRGNIAHWDVSKVKNMRGMFAEAVVHCNISSWDLQSVENLSRIFYKTKLCITLPKTFPSKKERPELYFKCNQNRETFKSDEKCKKCKMVIIQKEQKAKAERRRIAIQQEQRDRYRIQAQYITSYEQERVRVLQRTLQDYSDLTLDYIRYISR